MGKSIWIFIKMQYVQISMNPLNINLGPYLFLYKIKSNLNIVSCKQKQ